MMSFCGHWSVFLPAKKGNKPAFNREAAQKNDPQRLWRLLTDSPPGSRAPDMAASASVWCLNPWKRLLASAGLTQSNKRDKAGLQNLEEHVET